MILVSCFATIWTDYAGTVALDSDVVTVPHCDVPGAEAAYEEANEE